MNKHRQKPSMYKTLKQCRFNVDSTSRKLNQRLKRHCFNVVCLMGINATYETTEKKTTKKTKQKKNKHKKYRITTTEESTCNAQ